MNRIPSPGRLAVLMLIGLPLLVVSSCMSFNPRSLSSMEAALRESNPDLDIESSMKLGIGALTLDFIDFAFVHERSVDLSKISRADVGIYALNSPLAFNDFQMPQHLTSDRGCPRRDVILRIREDDEQVELVACIRNDKVTGLAMVVLEPREIVIMNVRGNFEALVGSLVRSSVNKKSRGFGTPESSDRTESPVVATLR